MAASSTKWGDSSMPDFMALEAQISDSISEFFTKAQFAAMTEYEKQRYRNIRKNYEMMNLVGMPIPCPDFMRPPRQKRVVPRSSGSESDAEWRPGGERGRTKKKKGFLPPPRHKKAVTQSSDSESDVEWTPSGERGRTRNKKDPRQAAFQRESRKRENAPARKKTSSVPAQPAEVKPRRYPVRDRKVRYMSLEIPDDDYFLFCEECNKEYEGDCPVHGPLNVVEDAEVSPDTKPAERAWSTLPPGLSIQQSTIPGAGLGVLALQPFPVRTQFGPYQGDLLTDPEAAQKSGYCWQIYTHGQPSHFVDACSTRSANWMRFVNCARTEEEQNLTAYQHQGQIYYRSYKPIPSGAELLVWYGEEYARDLGIQRNVKPPSLLQGSHREGIYACAHCRLAFSSWDHLRKHTWRCHSEKLEKRPSLSTDLPSVHHGSAKSPSTDNGTLSSKKVLPFSSTSCNLLNGNPFKERYTTDKNEKKEMCENDVNGSWGKRLCKSLNSTENLAIGATTHTDEECGNFFSPKSHLQTHMRTHTGERPYKCQQCGKAFSQSNNLHRHMRTHTGERPYKCQQCGKAFSRSGVLQRHMRTHTGERPYKCQQCGKAFSESGHLQRHMRTHTGERPYKCQQCGKAFSDRSGWRQHRGSHSREQ